jgi:hypothetical protein
VPLVDSRSLEEDLHELERIQSEAVLASRVILGESGPRGSDAPEKVCLGDPQLWPGTSAIRMVPAFPLAGREAHTLALEWMYFFGHMSFANHVTATRLGVIGSHWDERSSST